MTMKLTNIYYIAGLLDGEGYFGFAGSPTIQITSTDYDILENCKNAMQINTIIREQTAIAGNKRKYNLNICGSLAIQWMMTIYPLLCLRRKQRIKEVILMWKNMKNNIPNKCINGHELTNYNIKYEYTNSGIVRRCKICRKYKNRNLSSMRKENRL